MQECVDRPAVGIEEGDSLPRLAGRYHNRARDHHTMQKLVQRHDNNSQVATCCAIRFTTISANAVSELVDPLSHSH